MKDLYLIRYSVKGIKTLNELVTLSFYKKTISKNFDTQEYNIKGIYGMNGSGKTGIITSVDILKNIVINPEYLNNPIVQKNLDAIVNKEIKELFIEADYITKLDSVLIIFRYSITLSKNDTGRYVLSHEKLSSKKAISNRDTFITVYETKDGKLIKKFEKDESNVLSDIIYAETMNLLSSSSLSSIFFNKIFSYAAKDKEMYETFFFFNLITLLIFGKNMHVYLDQSDDHREYLVRNSFEGFDHSNKANNTMRHLMEDFIKLDNTSTNELSVYGNFVHKNAYDDFKLTVDKLYEFLHIFKSDLQYIEIDKKENHDVFVCSLIMVYDSYRIHAEFESTGIKKLIKLFTYLMEMAQGGIVFIDEFDSNLHDVYLCALLEYLMEYGQGQLCFTTHNVGPMDILKRNKKSIDFLSVDNKIYPWKTNGNYSPSKLYRNGMIEGSPFNVDSIDFINVFQPNGEDEEWAFS